MHKETMTSKERWLAVLQHKKPDRVPMEYWGTPEASEKLVRHLGVPDLGEAMQKLHVDMPLSVAPQYIGPAIDKDMDMYGCRFKETRYDGGMYRECITHPLADYETPEEIESNYVWPSAD